MTEKRYAAPVYRKIESKPEALMTVDVAMDQFALKRAWEKFCELEGINAFARLKEAIGQYLLREERQKQLARLPEPSEYETRGYCHEE